MIFSERIPATPTGGMMMANAFLTITFADLIEAYLDVRRPQIHDAITVHNERTLAAYEAALGVRVPRTQDDVPRDRVTDWMLFSRTVQSALTVRTPMTGFVENEVVYERLEELGVDGHEVTKLLNGIGESAVRTRELHTELLCRLLEIIVGRTGVTASIAEVKATGLYPGARVVGFDGLDPICTS